VRFTSLNVRFVTAAAGRSIPAEGNLVITTRYKEVIGYVSSLV